jgi:uncharacterized protein YbaA (DUF1428 family)
VPEDEQVRLETILRTLPVGVIPTAGLLGAGTRRGDMAYVDGFVLPVPRKNLPAYLRMAQKAGRIWQEYGALEYRECVGDDLNVKMGTSFPRQLNLKRGEIVVFSWIVYRSRAHRDRVNAKVMKDPRLARMATDMPLDPKRMVYGGFKAVVDMGRASAGGRASREPKRKGRVEMPAPQPAAPH